MEDYEILEILGEGSYGRAYLGLNLKHDFKCVLKRLKASHINHNDLKAAKKEVEVLSSLVHQHITKFYEAFQENEFLYIVMEYCSSGDLQTLIRNQKGRYLPEKRVLDLFIQLGLAVRFIHSKKIIHRDIKTQNIFLTQDGRIKLGDFGIAKKLDQTIDFSQTFIGTPYYLSPEMYENKPYSFKSDIWATGCVLYEITCLKHAFDAKNIATLRSIIINCSYDSIPPRYSRDLRNLIGLIFQRDPKVRPTMMNILSHDFLFKKLFRYVSQNEAEDFNKMCKTNLNRVRRNQPVIKQSSLYSREKFSSPASKYLQQTFSYRKFNPTLINGCKWSCRRKKRSLRGSTYSRVSCKRTFSSQSSLKNRVLASASKTISSKKCGGCLYKTKEGKCGSAYKFNVAAKRRIHSEGACNSLRNPKNNLSKVCTPKYKAHNNNIPKSGALKSTPRCSLKFKNTLDMILSGVQKGKYCTTKALFRRENVDINASDIENSTNSPKELRVNFQTSPLRETVEIEETRGRKSLEISDSQFLNNDCPLVNGASCCSSIFARNEINAHERRRRWNDVSQSSIVDVLSAAALMNQSCESVKSNLTNERSKSTNGNESEIADFLDQPVFCKKDAVGGSHNIQTSREDDSDIDDGAFYSSTLPGRNQNIHAEENFESKNANLFFSSNIAKNENLPSLGKLYNKYSNSCSFEFNGNENSKFKRKSRFSSLFRKIAKLNSKGDVSSLFGKSNLTDTDEKFEAESCKKTYDVQQDKSEEDRSYIMPSSLRGMTYDSGIASGKESLIRTIDSNSKLHCSSSVDCLLSVKDAKLSQTSLVKSYSFHNIHSLSSSVLSAPGFVSNMDNETSKRRDVARNLIDDVIQTAVQQCNVDYKSPVSTTMSVNDSSTRREIPVLNDSFFVQLSGKKESDRDLSLSPLLLPKLFDQSSHIVASKAASSHHEMIPSNVCLDESDAIQMQSDSSCSVTAWDKMTENPFLDQLILPKISISTPEQTSTMLYVCSEGTEELDSESKAWDVSAKEMDNYDCSPRDLDDTTSVDLNRSIYIDEIDALKAFDGDPSVSSRKLSNFPYVDTPIDDLHGWIEEKKAFFEQEIGLELFIKVYTCLESAYDKRKLENFNFAGELEMLRLLMGPENFHYWEEILNLVKVEGACFNEILSV